jgi:SdpI/YfhL protein family
MFSQPFFIPATLFLGLSLPLIFGLIPPNRFYGVRTMETLADKGLWYRANRLGGWPCLCPVCSISA